MNASAGSESRDFRYDAIGHAPDSMLAVAADGTIHAYHRGTSADGISGEAPVGRTLEAVLPAEAARLLGAGVEAALAAGETRTTIYSPVPEGAAAGDGRQPEDAGLHTRFIEARIVPGDGLAYCYLRDISEQRRAEQALIRHDLTYGALMQIYHRLLTAQPADPPVTPDMLAMLGYAASAREVTYVALTADTAGVTVKDDGLLWRADAARGASAPATAREHLARRPWTSWLPTLRSGRPVQSAEAPGGAPAGAAGGMCLAIPILAQDALVGLLCFEAPTRRAPWPEAEVELLRAATTAMAFHVERGWYLAQIEAHAEEIAQMNVDLVRARDVARASDRAKSDFLAVMGHELRTPLNPIISMTEMLLSSSLTGEQQEYAEMAHDAGMALLQQINAILDFVEVETGSVEIQALPLDPTALLAEVRDVLGRRARDKGLSLAVYCHPATPRLLVGDPQRVATVLHKLVDNAMKFTPSGDVIVRVEPVDGPPAGGSRVALRFSVSDTGIGLPAGADAWLFRPFTQADATITRAYGGTGLGLATARRWVAAMGGEIGARPNPAGGTVFWFTLPMGVAAASSDPPTVVGVDREASLAGLRVLIVDDLASNRGILTRYLEQMQVTAASTGDPREALTLLQRAHAARAPYHVAILDLLLPEMDGLALAAAIQQRGLSPGTRLVLLTAYDAPGQDVHARRSGFSAYLTKPLGRGQLHDILVHVMATLDAPAGVTLAHAGPAGDEAAASRTVLLIEQNTILRRMAARELERAGFRTVAVASVAGAVRALTEPATTALVLVDVTQHAADLPAVAARLRKLGRDAALPIVGMAARSGDDVRAACDRARLDGCLAKPLTPDTVRALYARWGVADVGAWPDEAAV